VTASDASIIQAAADQPRAMRLGCALISASLLSRAPPPCHRAGAVRLGLLDWMLADVPDKPAIETLCRPEGWDCILRIGD